MQRFLDRFQYHITPGWDILATAGALCLGLALLTVSYHSLRAARRSPAEALKNE